MGTSSTQHSWLNGHCWRFVFIIAIGVALSGVALAQENAGGSWQTNPNEAEPDTQFVIQGSINPSQAFVSQIEWVDNDRFLSLAITPGGAEVWRTSYSYPRPERFMSQEFLTRHICPQEYVHSLQFHVSPARNYIFFTWHGQNDILNHALVDISRAPSFRLKRISLPVGMQVSFASFSPDDSLVVLGHDPYRQDCGISLLAINLSSGLEDWRIESHKLNFINDIWWSIPVDGSTTISASATMFEGNFSERPSFFTIDPRNGIVSPGNSLDGVISGETANWGNAWVSETEPGAKFPYSLSAVISKNSTQLQIPLSSEVRDMRLLRNPGRVLISNTLDGSIIQLWLIDLASGDKFRIDLDCAEFALSTNDTLLVRGSKSNQLRVYRLEIPGSGPSTPIFSETGESIGVG